MQKDEINSINQEATLISNYLSSNTNSPHAKPKVLFDDFYSNTNINTNRSPINIETRKYGDDYSSEKPSGS